jgi:H/ACA ribonucleoprotein complex subunit 4
VTDLAPLPPEVVERVRAGTFLLIDKPRGPSSHQVTAWVRDILGLEKAGHAGTLDPGVSGLLWIGVGPALKLLPLMLDLPKRYVGLIAFHAPVREPDLQRVLTEFTGPVFQTPPVRSAVKRERRIRTIHHLTRLEGDSHHVLVDVTADSGTYVRTLAVDTGDALGVGAHLAELRRTATGPFLERHSVSVTVLSDAAAEARAGRPAALLALLHPIQEVWDQFPVLRLKASAAAAVAHGADLARGGIVSVSRGFSKGAHVVLVAPGGEMIAYGTALVAADEIPKVRKGWVVDAERVLADPARYPPIWSSPPPPKPAG